ncbi:hypothetical protein Tco_0874568 [Tanacetum coccineum]|uniref:Uncharacterized protein n=1 Tax=Tanacetum coccineum TaxID=301880 RepID=A0ABQ5BPU4_9ASTR
MYKISMLDTLEEMYNFEERLFFEEVGTCNGKKVINDASCNRVRESLSKTLLRDALRGLPGANSPRRDRGMLLGRARSGNYFPSIDKDITDNDITDEDCIYEPNSAMSKDKYVPVSQKHNPKVKSLVPVTGRVLELANITTWDEIVNKMGMRKSEICANKAKGKRKVVSKHLQLSLQLKLAFASKHLQLLAFEACICILQLQLPITACICRLLTHLLALAATKLTYFLALAACICFLPFADNLSR